MAEYTDKAHALLMALAKEAILPSGEAAYPARAFLAEQERRCTCDDHTQDCAVHVPLPPSKERTAEVVLSNMLLDLHDPARGERIREALALIRKERERVERAIALCAELGRLERVYPADVREILARLEGREP